MSSVPPPRAHGGDGVRVATALGLDPGEVLDLSASLNPVAPDAGAIVGKHLNAVRRYPDTTDATRMLAGAIGVDIDRVLLTNGGAEAIALVAGAVGGRVDEPDFGLYPRGAGPRWRSNPHNPSGLLASPTEGAAVWDEAFYPLATGTWTRGDARAVVVGSLTKVFACPGLRLGYVVADPEVIARLARRQPAWSVNGLAVAALPDLLDAVDLPAWAAEIGRLRRDLATVLRAAGFEPQPSDANWLLVDAPRLRNRLAPLGVVVRDCASFGLPGVVRIAVPDDAGRARLEEALQKETLKKETECAAG